MFRLVDFRALEKQRWFILFCALLVTAISFVTRFVLLNQYPAMPGADFGNYLTVVNIIEGHDVTGEGLRYPPLFFLVLMPFIHVFGEMLALKVVAALVASLCCVPMFFLTLRWTRLWVAFGVTVLFTFSKYFADMTAWGGSPNFLAIAFMITAFYFLDRALSEPENRRRFSLIVGALVGLVFLTHHLTIVVLGLFLVLFFIFAFAWERKKFYSDVLPAYAWMVPPAVVLSIPAVSVYLRMQEAASSSLGSAQTATLSSFIGPTGFEAIVGPHLVAWAIVYVFSACILVLAIRRPVEPGHKELLIAASIASPALIAFFVVGEVPSRGLAFLTIPLFLCVGLVVEMLLRGQVHLGSWVPPDRIKPLVLTVFTCGIVIAGSIGIAWIGGAVSFFKSIEDGEMAALDWVKENTPEDSVFATSGKYLSDVKEGNLIGWWIEGYCERPTVMTGTRSYRSFQNELDYVIDMNRFFNGDHIFENGKLRITDTYPLLHLANPLISVYRDGGYTEMAFLNDQEHTVSFMQNSSSTVQTVANLATVERTSLDIMTDGTSYSWTASSTTENFEVVRQVTIEDSDPTAVLRFSVSSLSDSIVQGLSLKLWPTGHVCSIDGVSDSTAHFSVTDHRGNRASVEASVLSGNGSLEDVTFDYADLLYGLPRVSIDLSGEGMIEVTLRITPVSSDLDELCPLGYYNAFDILEKYKVDYLFEFGFMENEIERFRLYPEYFSIVYETPSVVIFQVLRESFPV